MRGIYAVGFENPSPIQRKAIIPMLKKHDVIAQAQSGTGKTGCFTIAGLELDKYYTRSYSIQSFYRQQENYHIK